MLGFGIRSGKDVAHAHAVADGAIIGSAYLTALKRGTEKELLRELTTLTAQP